MKHLFVPYQIALQLKETGFNEPCFGIVYPDGEMFFGDTPFIKLMLGKQKETIPSPIYQQVVDWFRDKHGKHIEVFHQLRPANNIMYGYKIGSSDAGIEDGFNSYYEALNKAIEEAIKII